MTFDPFSAIPQPPADQNPVPNASSPVPQNPFVAPEDDDDDEIHFDLTGEGNAVSPQPSVTPMAEPELRVELTPIATPPAPAAAPMATPSFSAPWEMPSVTATAPEPANSFSLDIGTPSATPVIPPAAPASTASGLVSLFDRLVNMIEEETRAFESSQKKHQANIANEQRLIEEETMAFGKKKTDILQGLEDLKKRLAS